MYDPMAGRLLPYPLFHQRLLRAEQLHGQLVVRGLEEGLQLVAEEALLGVRGRRRGLHRGAVQRHIVQPPEVDLAGAAALLQRHVCVACGRRK